MTGLALAVALVALALLTATLIGLRLPKTHCAASRIRIQANPEQVWKLLIDRTTHPGWRPGIREVKLVEIDGQTGWIEICHRNIQVRFVETYQEAPFRLVTRMADGGGAFTGQWTYELQGQDGASTLTVTESAIIYHPLIRFFSRFVISYHGAMDVFLIALARHLGDRANPEHLSVRQRSDPTGIQPKSR
ncbi:MAG: SRPBCC family protein [Methylococcaceae bacterium]|nr:SRPBCC family protein [Methylococcaceae bacterium]